MELQQLIGVDKKNPNFTLCRNAKDPGKIYVFFGAAIFEIVLEDKRSTEWKLLIARLYNAGLKRKTLIEVFGVARTTMKRWGDALKSGSSQKLLRALSGAGAPKKVTHEIEGFIKLRFTEIYAQRHYGYSCCIRDEIKRVFDVEISCETLRPIFNRLKNELKNEQDKCVGDSKDNEDNSVKGLSTCDSEDRAKETTVENAHVTQEDESKQEESCNPDNRKNSLFFCDETFSSRTKSKATTCPASEIYFCNHVGVLIFSEMITKLGKCLSEENGNIIKQWVMTILLGAINIEQTKLLDFDSLQALFGHSLCRSLDFQRGHLLQLAVQNKDNKNILLKFNASIVNAVDESNFYYDPHTKHYTGIKRILKGWISSMNRADKTMNMDFIHTSKGEPVYVTHTDVFHDLRERFDGVIKDFREVIGFDENRELCFIFDRGIYKMEVFEMILQSKNTQIVTWEKGYKKDGWSEEEMSGEFIMEKERNSSMDLLLYKFEYISSPWSKNDGLERIIVRATNPKNRMIEVSILFSNKKSSPEEMIRLMFRRWLQENDFKYLEKHFGINQITSYASTPYRRLKNSVDDKDMLSGEYKALQLQKTNIKKDLKTALLSEHTGKKKNKKREEKIKELTDQLNKVDERLSQTNKKVSRLETLIEEQYSQLDTAQKGVMDSIKIITRNMFYEALEPFRELYDNYRDDHTIFRNLTRSHGCVVFETNEVKVILFPTANYPPKTRKIIEDVLEEINRGNPVMPYGSKRKIHFELGKKRSKLFAIGK